MASTPQVRYHSGALAAPEQGFCRGSLQPVRAILDLMRERRTIDPLRIVVIGGGNGLSAMLHGLKDLIFGRNGRTVDIDLTAVVTVTDDGGSSGRLRREFDVLPPGDIRNCMVAMSEDEGLLSRLFQYRFESGRGLKGHSFGNLFLTALTHLTGDFAKAVQLSSEVLASCGRIYPSTATNVVLEAELADGQIVTGETRISRTRPRIVKVRLRPGDVDPHPETLEAIAEADLITFGPGSLFTSVIPNLLVNGIPGAIRNSPALKAYFVNLMWQPGETNEFTASDHVERDPPACRHEPDRCRDPEYPPDHCHPEEPLCGGRGKTGGKRHGRAARDGCRSDGGGAGRRVAKRYATIPQPRPRSCVALARRAHGRPHSPPSYPHNQ